MPAKTSTLAEVQEKEKSVFPDNSTEGITLDVDYAEDRPVALLAERQRKFQESLCGHYVDAELPAA